MQTYYNILSDVIHMSQSFKEKILSGTPEQSLSVLSSFVSDANYKNLQPDSNKSQGWGNAFIRTSPVPIDRYAIFPSYDTAKAYAKSNVVAYEGQVIAVNDGGKQVIYVLDNAPDVSAAGLRRVGVISADELCGISEYAKVVDLNAVSGAVDKKIWVEDRIDRTVSGYGDLSVIKLPKEDYDLLVASSSPLLCGNVLYLPHADYIDAYSQTIENLSTPGYGLAQAANVNCVSVVSVNVIDEVKPAIRQLCGDISSKIWIEDRISSVSAYGDLSVIQLPMDEFGEFVAKTGGRLASNTLYIPYGEYINAFGQELRNLSTPGIPGYSEAANVSCVSSMIQQYSPRFSDLSDDPIISGLLSVAGTDGIGGIGLADAVSALVNLCWKLIRGA